MAAIGTQAEMGWGSTSTVDKPIEFLSESIKKQQQILDTNGIRGTRSVPKERTREGGYTVGGSISCNPAPDELDTILRYATGTAKDMSNQFPLAETIEEFYITVDRQTKVFTYAGCKVGQLRLACSEGRLLECQIQVVGKTETVGNAGTFPSLTQTVLEPYCFYDAVMTIGGSPYKVRDWAVTIDNGLRPRMLNSQTVTDIPEVDRNIGVQVTIPYTSTEQALYDTGDTGAAVVFTLTNGGYSLTLSMADVQFNTESPSVAGKDEFWLSLGGRARKSGSTLELVITNDSTA